MVGVGVVVVVEVEVVVGVGVVVGVVVVVEVEVGVGVVVEVEVGVGVILIIKPSGRKFMKKVEKVIKNGKVAVAISPGFGAGWTTWNSEILPFEPKVIKMILAGKQSEITEEWCKENLGIDNVYCGGVDDLKVVWVEKGSKFSINEYDGSESLYIDKELDFTT